MADGYVGHLDWDDCQRCGHCDPKTGECAKHVTLGDLEDEYDFILCQLFTSIEELEQQEAEEAKKDRINPNQGTLDV